MATNEDLLFVELAMKREVLTPEQVDEILALQKKLGEMGLVEAIADLVVKKGILAPADAQAILTKVSPKGGRQQIEGYRLVERLGRGGMGAVYKAMQVSMGRAVAIKVLKPSLVKSDQQTERLRREARLVGKLSHPNIVQGLDFGISNGFHYFTMEYVEGESVRDALEARGPMKEKEALRIVKEVTLALEYAHRQGVVHRDVKPGNILLGKDGTVRLADYGLAKGPLEDVELTHSGVTVGTPQYISPEQARGPSDVDIRTDLYSLGATLYHMVTGRPPFEGETLAHLIQQVLYESYPPPRRLRKDVSPSVDFLIEKLMARVPRHRYQNPRALLSDLETIERGRSIVPAGWQGDFESLHRRKKRRRLTVAAIAVLLIAGGASAVMVVKQREEDRRVWEGQASAALGTLLSTEPTPESLPERIDEFEALVRGEFEGSAAAALAERVHLPRYRAQLRNVEALQLKRQEAKELADAGEYAKARDLFDRYITELEGLPEEEAAPALVEARVYAGILLTSRDEAIAEASRRKLDEIAKKEPKDALESLRAFHERLKSRMYREGENLAGLDSLVRVRDDLETGVDWVERELRPLQRSLEAEGARDYRDIGRRAAEVRDRRTKNTELTEALNRLPVGLKEKLESGLSEIESRNLALNLEELRKTLDDAEALWKQQASYEQARKLLETLAGRSLPGPEATLAGEARRVAEGLELAKTTGTAAFAQFRRDFLRLLGERDWDAALAQIALAQERAVTWQGSPYTVLLESATRTFEFTRVLEDRFRGWLHDQDQLPDGLWVEGARLRDLYDVRLEGDLLLFRTADGARKKLPISKVALKDLTRYTALEERDPRVSYPLALLRLGELTRANSLRRVKEEIGSVLGEVSKALGDPELGPFAKEVNDQVSALKLQADQFATTQENIARATWEKVNEDYRYGRWQDAYNGLMDLLEKESLNETEFVKRHRKNDMEPMLEEVKRKLPSVGIREYFSARTFHLAGHSVRSRDFRERVIFDLEDPAQLDRFEFTDGRIGILTEERIVLGPPPPGRPGDEDRTRVEHVLEFLPAATVEGEWPKYHPLELESPFLYSEPMAIEFRVRFDHPLALLLSLTGTNVIVLSDDGRRESGRGVHIWQGEDLSRPDRIVPERMRRTWLERHPEALEGEARHNEYFQFEPARWYRVRFEKDEKNATLLVDGVVVLSRGDIKQYGVETERLVIRTWTPAQIDEIAVEGTLDPDWYYRRVFTGRGK